MSCDEPTSWAIPIDDEDDKYIVYQPLAGVAFVANGALARLACNEPSDSGAARSVKAEEFLAAIGFRAGERDWRPARPDDVPRSAVLLTTNECQLRCTYCYASGGDGPTQELSIDRARTTIDAVVKAAMAAGRRHFDVSFHGGGEPTRAWELIRAATQYAREQPIEATITLTSNGMWSAAQCRWIVGHIDGITISLDGTPTTQDRNRPLRTGHGSSTVVMRNLDALGRASKRYGIRMTATKPWRDLADDVAYLLAHTSCRLLRVEPAFNHDRGEHLEPDTQDAADFADAFLAAWDVAQSVGARLVYTGADVSAARSVFCSAPSNALIVTPTGDLVTCYEVTNGSHPLAEISTIGQVDPGCVQVSTAGRSELLAMIADRRTACRDCFCYWTCAGDCYVRSFRPGPDGHLACGTTCKLNQTLTSAVLLRLIAEGGGVWKRSTTPFVRSDRQAALAAAPSRKD